jgi:uncharacterized protein YneR
LSKKLLEGYNVKDIFYYTVDKEPVKADYAVKSDDIYVAVDEVDLWGVIKVEKK